MQLLQGANGRIDRNNEWRKENKAMKTGIKFVWSWSSINCELNQETFLTEMLDNIF